MTDGTQHATERVDRRGLEIDWLRAAAGALAAVASAFLLSFLGAAGTIIGAALGSLIVTVSSAVFAQGLSTSKRTLEKAQAAAARKVGIAQAEVLRAERASHTAAHDSHLEHADERLAQAQRDLDAVSAGGGAPWADRLRALPWKRILMAAGALFVAAIVLITAIELAAGRSVSSITGGSGGGGTTIGHVGNRGSSDNDRQDRKSPGPDDTSSPSPSDQTTPSGEPTPSDSVEPSQTPSQSPSVDTGEGASDGPSQTPDDLSSQPAAPSASP